MQPTVFLEIFCEFSVILHGEPAVKCVNNPLFLSVDASMKACMGVTGAQMRPL